MELAIAVLSSIFAAGGAYAAVRVELRFLWRDLGKIEHRLDRVEGVDRAIR